MFYHRILPQPLPPSTTRRESSSTDSSSLYLPHPGEDDSMMTLSDRTALPMHKNIRDHAHTVQEDNHRNKHFASSKGLSSPGSQRPVPDLRDMKTSHVDTKGMFQGLESKLPSISREGDLSFQDSPPHLCLCQPDPKVPRPRNAFILFRQHHQAAVVSQHPGLANPDISKIIGDAWRSSSTETKDHWKKLADEEKLRHQKLYPDYRYQPRRPGRNSITNPITIDPETHLCLKCGGKTMQTPSTLATPSRPMLFESSVNGNAILSRGSQYIGSPSFPPGPLELARPPPKDSLSKLSLRQRDTSLYDATESKKRKLDGPDTPPTGMRSPPSYPSRRASIPHPENLASSPNTSVIRSPKSSTRSTVNPGVTLAPLQIDKLRETASHSQAIEAMVMSIPALMKIKVLARISPPLAVPGPMSPAHDTRGALIAVDGFDQEAVELTTNYLKEYLERDGDYQVRFVWKPAITPSFKNHISWLDAIRAYHDESAEIVRYITTFPPANEGSNSEHSARRASNKSVKEITRDNKDEDMESSPMSSSSHATKTSHNFSTNKRPIPIVIAPFYQLSLTNLAASQIPINDEYAPTDHWQWMATLWRGIVGPDVTIDIQHPGSFPGFGLHGMPNPGQPSAGLVSGSFQRRTSISTPIINRDTNMTRAQNMNDVRGIAGVQPPASAGTMLLVDVRLQEARAVFLRGEDGGRVSETGLRRTGFEVGEWLRDIQGREQDKVKRERARN